MSFSQICYPILLLSFLAIVNGKNTDSEFTQKVRSDFPPQSFEKLFNTNHDSVNQFLMALIKAELAEANIVGTTFPNSLNDELEVDIKDFASKCTPDALFRIYVNAVGETLEGKDVLKADNKDDLAKKLAEFLENGAKSVKKNNIEASLPAISSAVFKYFKSLDLATEEVLHIFTTNVLNQVNLEYRQ